jgi:alkylation response protein AidB-like acyl-CoA dehydrogenase
LRLIDVVEEVSRADGSAGWCVGIGIGTNYLAGMLPEQEAKEVFRDESRPSAGPFAPGGRAVVSGDGYLISGRWTYASGCRHAATAASGVMLFEGGKPIELNPDGSPVLRLAVLTEDQFTVEETWDTVGMRGTGSDDITAVDVLVPRDRIGTLWDPMWPDDAIFRLRSFDMLGPCLGAVPLGIGRAALDVVTSEVDAQSKNPPPPGRRLALADDPVAHLEFGRAATRLHGARSSLLDAVDDAYQHAVVGDQPPRAVSARIGLACLEAMNAGLAALDTACALMGSASIRPDSILDRMRRDLATARTHVIFSSRLAVGLGCQLAGIDTVAFPFLPV